MIEGRRPVAGKRDPIGLFEKQIVCYVVLLYDDTVFH
jgi:hypothetical protein